MQHILVDPVAPDPNALRRAADIVLAGGVVAYPTDTLYGLAADPRNATAIRRLFEVKERGPDQAIPLIAASADQVEATLGRLTPVARRLAAAFWPGPLTIVIPGPAGIVAAARSADGTIAVRVPDHAVACLLAEKNAFPITSTSANVSGQAPTAEPEAVIRSLAARIDAIVDAGRSPGGLPSTIVDATGAVARLVRAGVVPWDRVLECL